MLALRLGQMVNDFQFGKNGSAFECVVGVALAQKPQLHASTSTAIPTKFPKIDLFGCISIGQAGCKTRDVPGRTEARKFDLNVHSSSFDSIVIDPRDPSFNPADGELTLLDE